MTAAQIHVSQQGYLPTGEMGRDLLVTLADGDKSIALCGFENYALKVNDTEIYLEGFGNARSKEHVAMIKPGAKLRLRAPHEAFCFHGFVDIANVQILGKDEDKFQGHLYLTKTEGLPS